MNQEVGVDREEVFDFLEALDEDTGATRKSWQGVPNGAFDEGNRLLYKVPDRIFTGSVNWANHFHCSKCGEHFFYPGQLECHVQRCHFTFDQSNPLTSTEARLASQQGKDVHVAHITDESGSGEKKVCEALSHWTKMETCWDRPILCEENWRIPQFNSHAFVLTVDGRLTSYILFREKLRSNSRKALKFVLPFVEGDHGVGCDAGWAVGEIFTVQSERGRGYARQLFTAALSDIAERASSIAYLAPLTKDGEKFVTSLELSEIVLAHE